MAGQKLIEYQINNFKSGVISQRFNGNIDTKDYTEGAKEIINGLVLSSGGVTFRPGFEIASTAITEATPATVMIPFNVYNNSNVLKNYVVCFFGSNIRIVDLSINPIVVSTSELETLPASWSGATTEKMKYVVDGRKIFFANLGYKPLVLTYDGANFSLTEFVIAGADWPAFVSANISLLAGDCPGSVAIYEGRLVFGGSRNNPLLYWGSMAGDYTKFNISSPITDADGYEKSVNVIGATRINWMIGLGPLFFGTDAGIATKSSRYEIMTSLTSSFTLMASSFGSDNVQGFIMGGEVFFIEKGGKKIRMARYSSESESFFTPEITYKSENLFTSKIISVAIQQIPESTLWILLEGGKLLSMAFDPVHEVFAWGSHEIDADIYSMCIAQSGDEERLILTSKKDSQLSLIKMSKILEEDQYEMNYLDWSQTIDHGAEIDVADTIVGTELRISEDGPGFSNLATLKFVKVRNRISGVETPVSGLTDVNCQIVDIGGSVYKIRKANGEALDATGLVLTDISVQIVAKTFNFTSLPYSGEFSCYADGSYYGDYSYVGVNPDVVLDDYVNKLTIGHKYSLKIKPVNPAAGKWRKKRIVAVSVERYQSLGGKVGPSESMLEPFPVSTVPTLDALPPLETNMVKVPSRGGTNYSGELVVIQDIPLPFTLLALMYTLELED